LGLKTNHLATLVAQTREETQAHMQGDQIGRFLAFSVT
jgi:hypothetical protein